LLPVLHDELSQEELPLQLELKLELVPPESHSFPPQALHAEDELVLEKRLLRNKSSERIVFCDDPQLEFQSDEVLLNDVPLEEPQADGAADATVQLPHDDAGL